MKDELKPLEHDEITNSSYNTPPLLSQVEASTELIKQILSDKEKHSDYSNQLASLELAEVHQKASKVFDASKLPPSEEMKFCDDCLNLIPPTDDIPKFDLGVEIKELCQLGTGVYFYFFFLKYIFVILMFLFAGVSLFTVSMTVGYNKELIAYCKAGNKIIIEENAGSTLAWITVGSNKNSTMIASAGVTPSESNSNQRPKVLKDKCKAILNSGILFKINYQNIILYQEVIKQNSYRSIVTTNSTTLSSLSTNFTLTSTSTSISTKVIPIFQFNQKPIFNIENDTSLNFSLINLIAIAALFIINGCYIIILNHLEYEAEYKVITAQDYTLMINDLNPHTMSENLSGVTSMIESDGIRPIEVHFTYELSEYYCFKEAFQLAKKKLRVLMAENKDSKSFGLCSKPETKHSIVRDLVRLDNKINCWIDKTKSVSERSKLLTNTVFAVFKDHHTLENYKASFGGLKSLTSNITINNSPEPNDVNWENLVLTSKQRLYRTIAIYLVVLFILLLSFITLLNINVTQKRLTAIQKMLPKDKQNIFKELLLAAGFAMVINIINFIVSKLMIKLTLFEKNTSSSSYQLSLSIKLGIFTFLNTGPIPVLVFFINDGVNIDILVKNSLMTFGVNCVVNPCLYMVNPMWWVQQILRKMIIKNPLQMKTMTQGELNKAFEDNDMELANKYSYMANTCLLSVFYLPIFPLGIIFSFFGMCMMYYIEKYNVLFRYKRPAKIDGRITDFYIDAFKLTILIYSISSFSFFEGVYASAGFNDGVTGDRNRFFSGILNLSYEKLGLGICLIMAMIPYAELLGKIMLVRAIDTDHDGYMDQYFEIGMNYDMANPITKDKGFEDYLNRMLSSGIINESEHSSHLKLIKTAPSDIVELFFKKKYGGDGKKNKNYSNVDIEMSRVDTLNVKID